MIPLMIMVLLLTLVATAAIWKWKWQHLQWYPRTTSGWTKAASISTNISIIGPGTSSQLTLPEKMMIPYSCKKSCNNDLEESHRIVNLTTILNTDNTNPHVQVHDMKNDGSLSISSSSSCCQHELAVLHDNLRVNGWCFVDLPPSLNHLSSLLLDATLTSFDDKSSQHITYGSTNNRNSSNNTNGNGNDDDVTSKGRGRYGFVRVDHLKTAFRALTGPLINQMIVPSSMSSLLTQVAASLDTLCHQLVTNHAHTLFGVSLEQIASHKLPLFMNDTSSPGYNCNSSSPIMTNSSTKKVGYGMLDIVRYDVKGNTSLTGLRLHLPSTYPYPSIHRSVRPSIHSYDNQATQYR
jgi:hypothetical protein